MELWGRRVEFSKFSPKGVVLDFSHEKGRVGKNRGIVFKKVGIPYLG